jgi:hypothetical protein
VGYKAWQQSNQPAAVIAYKVIYRSRYIPKTWKLQDMYEKVQVLFMHKSSVQTLAQVLS